jgi:Rad3-related DNA helicase
MNYQGRKHKSCPYFVSRKIHQSGPAVSFAPYAYLLNSSIREATGVDLKDAIVVFDEVQCSFNSV